MQLDRVEIEPFLLVCDAVSCHKPILDETVAYDKKRRRIYHSGQCSSEVAKETVQLCGSSGMRDVTIMSVDGSNPNLENVDRYVVFNLYRMGIIKPFRQLNGLELK